MPSGLFCRSIKEEYPPCIVWYISKGVTQRLRWKLPDGLIFLHHFQHLSLHSNQFTQNLNKLYTSIFRNNHSIYWWKPDGNPCSSFLVFREQTDRRGGGLCFIICIDIDIDYIVKSMQNSIKCTIMGLYCVSWRRSLNLFS